MGLGVLNTNCSKRSIRLDLKKPGWGPLTRRGGSDRLGPTCWSTTSLQVMARLPDSATRWSKRSIGASPTPGVFAFG